MCSPQKILPRWLHSSNPAPPLTLISLDNRLITLISLDNRLINTHTPTTPPASTTWWTTKTTWPSWPWFLHGILQLFFRSVRFFVFLKTFFSKNQEDYFFCTECSIRIHLLCVLFFCLFIKKKLLSTMCISNRSNEKKMLLIKECC